MDKTKAIIQAVNQLKKSQFGATAIKVELEAELGRGYSDGCNESHDCLECNGEWEEVVECDSCDGHGHFRQVSGEWINCNEEDAGSVECEDCWGTGRRSCQYCEEGVRECDGECNSSDGYGSELACHDYLMEQLAELGLAKKYDGYTSRLSHGSYSIWHPILPLKYAEFYRDGSVDSEFTFTLMMDNPENIFLLPKVIEVWNRFTEEIGNDVDVRGAGMHMALLNSADGNYGTSGAGRYSDIDLQRFNNFKNSMQLLLPALYCLGASNENSRGLGYRRPTIERDSHRAAIDWRNGALEFRIFDTCYENPEIILDNIVVMSKCMKYWSTKRIANGLNKITSQVTFGDNGGEKLDRFYFQVEHIDLLNEGLRKLKPSYYTITEIKKQRSLGINKRTINSRFTQYRKQIEVEYEEYVERFNWNLLALRHRRLADAIESSPRNTPLLEIEINVERSIKTREAERQEKPVYIEQKISEYNNRRGEYILCAE